MGPATPDRGEPDFEPVYRHPAEARAEAEDIVPPGGITQAAAVIRTVGQRQHAQREGDRGAATAAARGARLLIGVEGRAIDGIVGVRAEAKLRRIGLADDDGAGVAQPLD